MSAGYEWSHDCEFGRKFNSIFGGVLDTEEMDDVDRLSAINVCVAILDSPSRC